MDSLGTKGLAAYLIGCANQLGYFGRLHRSTPERNFEFGRYLRRSWLFWNHSIQQSAPRRLAWSTKTDRAGLLKWLVRRGLSQKAGSGLPSCGQLCHGYFGRSRRNGRNCKWLRPARLRGPWHNCPLPWASLRQSHSPKHAMPRLAAGAEERFPIGHRSAGGFPDRRSGFCPSLSSAMAGNPGLPDKGQGTHADVRFPIVDGGPRLL